MRRRNTFIALLILTGISASVAVLAQTDKPPASPDLEKGEPARARLLRTDSPAPYVHRLTLYDHAGEAIDPTSAEAKPYSPKMTCGKCHPYAEIAHGWHFNSAGGAGILPGGPGTKGGTGVSPVADDANKKRLQAGSTSELADGRPGEPWIFADARLGVQIPVSLRGWPGAFTPGQVGLTSWQFTLQFGRHLCGGGFAEGTSESAPLAGARGSDVPQPPSAADLAPRGGARGS
ncbi:MAG: hypothetical protein HZB38_12360, partial [Planctomycetes bacterium]|nr:hypothetical protein [Planctomycetota bacterium]